MPVTSSIERFTRELPHGITLSCRASGRVGAPLLVFLHGFPEGAFVWDGLLAHFARPENGGYRCIAPNLRGFEASSSPAEPAAYRAKHLTQDLLALIASEGGRADAVIAHDWGGALGWTLACQPGAPLERLVIINSPHPGPFQRELAGCAAQQAASAYMNFLARPDAPELLAENDFARLWPFFEKMGAGAEARGWLTPEVKEQYREVWRHGLRGGCNYYATSPLRPPTPDFAGAAGVKLDDAAITVRVPALVLWALDDLALPPSLIDGLDRWVPRMTLETIADATHWVVHERPEWLAERIGRYLREGR